MDFLRDQAKITGQVLEDMGTALRKDFKFLGDTGCYYFLHVVGEEVPPYDEWARSRGIEMR